MKSKHLAKADFLRELKHKVEKLYALGTSKRGGDEWNLLAMSARGFIECGMLMGVAEDVDINRVIERAHEQQFGETLTSYRKRRSEENEQDGKDDTLCDADLTWDEFDSPAFVRKKSRKK